MVDAPDRKPDALRSATSVPDRSFRLVVLSGKGGTGKTTVAVAVAAAVPGAQLLDCDVEEPNAHLFLRPEAESREDVRTMLPVVSEKLCDGCVNHPRPICPTVCEFGAISAVKGKVLIFPEMCHSCGACIQFCPRGALREGSVVVGCVETGRARGIELVRGTLAVGQPRMIPVLRAVKKRARRTGTVVFDAPPGVACSAVETLRGANAALLVTEPTPFGRHDLELAITLCREMGVPAGIVLNRADVGDAGVEELARREGVEILLRIPWDREIAEGGARGEILTDIRPEYVTKLNDVTEKLARLARRGPEAA